MGRLLSLLGGGAFRALTGQLQQAFAAYEAAQTDATRQAAQVEIQRLQGLIAMQQQAANIRLATAGQWEMRLLVFLAGIGPVLHYLAVCTVSTWPGYFKGWTVLALPAPMDQWEGYVILSFFGLGAINKIGALVAWRKG